MVVVRVFLFVAMGALSGCGILGSLTSSSSSSSGVFGATDQGHSRGGWGGSSSSATGSSYGSTDSGGGQYQAWWDGYHDPNGDYTGRDLTRITLRELGRLNSDFYQIIPRDVRDWCPAFPRQNREGRKAFYLGLLSGIARFETDFRAHVKYLEAGGHYSRGLFQLGQKALSYYPDSRCDVSGDPRQLHDLQENIACGVMLVDYWVRRDEYIASPGNAGNADGRYFGIARYWATLREGRRGHDEIQSFTRNLPACR